MGLGMGLNLLLLLAMVATNILSLYHLSSLRHPSASPSHSHPIPVPDHLLHQLHTIRATISHLSRLHSAPSPPPPPPELLLFSRLSPIASSCSDHPDLLRRFMTYTPFSPCPRDTLSVAEPLLLRGCHPLPRRRCFSPTPPTPLAPSSLPSHPFPSSPLPDAAVLWPPTSPCRSFSCLPPNLGFDFRSTEPSRFLSFRSALDLPLPQLLTIANAAGAAPIRLALDIAGGTGTLAAHLKLMANATVVTTTMNLGAPYSEAAALRGVVPLHAPLQQRLPVHDGAMDLVRTGHAVNRWIPVPAIEFLLYDADRVLKAGGLLWIDRFFCKAADLQTVYGPLIGRLGYKRIKWAVGNKTDASGIKHGEVYLTALLQKPKQTTLPVGGGGSGKA
ncbi:hypothetical protein AXF42_Ash012029 [Apostasia shenzhenica]|uniref:Methyltransferase type 11 domain-containing protein n=1 Tax=Apostasia shenzhenica TaxID=1088818 RepID=A0A2I0AJL5_9ASPA|nr:hypothetical protein AXF42_Ash012029 [Apostasia shenzhenica]